MARKYSLNKTSSEDRLGINFSAELNEQQFLAVSSKPGPALVIAGAGSGKTRTLTYRVAYLLDQGIDSRNILLLTFTNKAAREMMERVHELVDRDLSDMWGGTFHSIGNRILRRHAEEMGLTRSFSIMDRDDQKSLLKTVIAEENIDTKNRRFPKPDVLASIFSLVVNMRESVEDIIDWRYDYFNEWAEEISDIHKKYEKKKIATNSVDFDDLLVKLLDLFKRHPELLAMYQKRFQFVLVDEYQDTNKVQSELIDLLVAKTKSLMVVGDDAQSIYSWRGANMDHILNFPEKYPEAKVYKIETNYRSIPEILDLSNAAIRANEKQFEKTLKSAREPGSALPALVPLDTPSTQAEFVKQRILELRDEGVELEEMAILYRAHHQSLEIQMNLTSANIPFQITSGLRFFEQQHVKDVSAYIRFVVNRRDEVSFKRMVSLLPGIGGKSAERLWGAWMKSGWVSKAQLPESFSKILLEFPVPKKAMKFWEQLCYTLDELILNEGFAAPSSMIYSILEGSYDEYMRGTFDNYDNRRKDIEQLMQYAEGFNDIEELLSQLSLLSSVDADPSGNKNASDDEQVTLSSIHQAKGLEWKVVFVISLTNGMFPNGKILDADDQDMLEEERRLFYVAVTRARDELYLTYPQINPKSYSGDILQEPSMFLDDFSKELVEEWQVSSGFDDW